MEKQPSRGEVTTGEIRVAFSLSDHAHGIAELDGRCGHALQTRCTHATGGPDERDAGEQLLERRMQRMSMGGGGQSGGAQSQHRTSQTHRSLIGERKKVIRLAENSAGSGKAGAMSGC
jgi:hypothetical protein